MYAAESGHDAVVRLLLQSGATADTPDDEQWTAMILAAATKGHDKAVALLREHGASMDLPRLCWLLISETTGDATTATP